jgi:ribonuclease HII
MSNKNVVNAIIIDDDNVEHDNVEHNNVEHNNVEHNNIEHDNVKQKKEIIRKPKKVLNKYYNCNELVFEIGIDEAGRGPLFGRVYSGAVILPKDNSFDHSKMKDSKKFHSKKKIEEVATYIKANAIAWSVCYEEEEVIDEINILQATQSAMHKAIKNVLNQLKHKNLVLDYNNILLLVDGNYFKQYTFINSQTNKFETLNYNTIEGGDNTYSCIAAASILAKVERDKYIDDLCKENPELGERYGIDTNKGYGAKKHIDGIKQYGITKWHRKSFGICKTFDL